MVKVGAICHIPLWTEGGSPRVAVNKVDDVWPQALEAYSHIDEELTAMLLTACVNWKDQFMYYNLQPDQQTRQRLTKSVAFHSEDIDGNRFARFMYYIEPGEVTIGCCDRPCSTQKYMDTLQFDAATFEANFKRTKWWSLRKVPTWTIEPHESRRIDTFRSYDPTSLAEGIVAEVDEYMTLPAHPQADKRQSICNGAMGSIGPSTAEQAGTIPRMPIIPCDFGGIDVLPKYQVSGVVLYPFAIRTLTNTNPLGISNNPLTVYRGTLPETVVPTLVNGRDTLIDGWLETFYNFYNACQIPVSNFTYQEDLIASLFVGGDTGTLYAIYGIKDSRGKSYAEIRNTMGGHLKPKTTGEETSWRMSTEDVLRGLRLRGLQIAPQNPQAPREIYQALDRVSDSFRVR